MRTRSFHMDARAGGAKWPLTLAAELDDMGVQLVGTIGPLPAGGIPDRDALKQFCSDVLNLIEEAEHREGLI